MASEKSIFSKCKSILFFRGHAKLLGYSLRCNENAQNSTDYKLQLPVLDFFSRVDFEVPDFDCMKLGHGSTMSYLSISKRAHRGIYLFSYKPSPHNEVRRISGAPKLEPQKYYPQKLKVHFRQDNIKTVTHKHRLGGRLEHHSTPCSNLEWVAKIMEQPNMSNFAQNDDLC